jgi:hypothetical protein
MCCGAVLLSIPCLCSVVCAVTRTICRYTAISANPTAKRAHRPTAGIVSLKALLCCSYRCRLVCGGSVRPSTCLWPSTSEPVAGPNPKSIARNGSFTPSHGACRPSTSSSPCPMAKSAARCRARPGASLWRTIGCGACSIYPLASSLWSAPRPWDRSFMPLLWPLVPCRRRDDRAP